MTHRNYRQICSYSGLSVDFQFKVDPEWVDRQEARSLTMKVMTQTLDGPERDIEYDRLLAKIWRLPPKRIMQIAAELARVHEDWLCHRTTGIEITDN